MPIFEPSQSPEPKSACTPTSVPIDAITSAEFPPTCGAEIPPGQRFCGGCGTELAPAAAAPAQPPREAAVSERRLVTVLFADLVGFTSLSESRDAEEVRELLSRYFEIARRLVGLYG